MENRRIYSFIPFLLLTLLVGRLDALREARSTDLPAVERLPVVPICGLTHIGGIPHPLLKQPLPLRPALGTFSAPTSTLSPQAQPYFEQGMAYLHGYTLIEAARSFHEALRHDSTLVMAHIGLSRVYSQLEDRPAAWKAAEKAKTLSRYASEREKAHLDVRFAQLKACDSLSNQKLLNEYRRVVNQAVRRFPNDPELWLLAGASQERYASGRGQGYSAAGIAIYEKVLQQTPDHPAAHHFLIHAYEGMNDYGKALEHGEAYARLAPELPHALHMYAHDLMKTGRTDEAIANMKRADELERKLYASDQYKAELDWHHIHNISLLALCYQYEGRIREAEQLMKEKFALGRPNPERIFYNKISYPELLISQNRYGEAYPIANALTKATTAGERLTGHYLLGIMHLRQNALFKAKTALKAAQKEVPAVTRTDGTGYNIGTLEPYLKFLSALIALNDPTDREKSMAAIRSFQKSCREQFGPDPWIEALFQLETIAQITSRLDMPDFAEESARVLAEHDPTYSGSHLALARVAEQKGDQTAAERERNLARQRWTRADPEFLARAFPR